MTDYKYEELIDDLRIQVEICEKYKKFCEGELELYKSFLETDNKFELKSHEYWRTNIICTDNQINFLKEVLKKQDELMEEEIEEFEREEEFRSELKYNASFGI